MNKLFADATGCLRLALLALCCLSNAALAALPRGGQVAAGSGSVSQSGTRMDIVQRSQSMVMNWNDFSIGADETVSISQPSAASTLLIRVIGAEPAKIAGELWSNGRVVILDSAGIIFHASAEIDVGGLTASTLQISDADFLAGEMKFSNGGAGTVANFGRVDVPTGGLVALMAPQVINDGAIIAPAGVVDLIAATAVDLTVPDRPVLGEWFDDSIIRLSGLVSAQSGRVQLYASRIDVTGQFDVQGGTLLLDPDDIWIDTSTASVSTGTDLGAVTLNASSGGDITVAGSTTATGTLNVSGATATLAGNVTLSGAGNLSTTDVLPASGNISVADGSFSNSGANLTATTASIAPEITASSIQLRGILNVAPELHVVNMGTISQHLTSAANTYIVNATGAVFGTSAVVATAGLVSLTGASVDLASLSISANQQVAAGWNLLGNGTDAPLDVAAAFGDTSRVNTVWKWNAATAKWAFYAPSMSAQALADYAAGKGYEVLASIGGGEGFWVNAQAPFVYALPIANLLPAASVQAQLPSGWSLVAVGEETPPSVFGAALGQAAAGGGASLWAWDKAQSKWYFHAPSLEAQGGTALADYAANKGYIDFKAASKLLAAGMGFWVRKP